MPFLLIRNFEAVMLPGKYIIFIHLNTRVPFYCNRSKVMSLFLISTLPATIHHYTSHLSLVTATKRIKIMFHYLNGLAGRPPCIVSLVVSSPRGNQSQWTRQGSSGGGLPRALWTVSKISRHIWCTISAGSRATM